MKKNNNWYEFQGELRSLLAQNKPQGVKIEESIIIIIFFSKRLNVAFAGFFPRLTSQRGDSLFQALR